MKTRLSSTEPPAPDGFTNAVFAEVLEDGIRKIAAWIPASVAATGGSNWWGRFVIMGLQPPAEDILVNRYRIVIEADQVITLRKCGTTAKTGPVGTYFAANVLRSNDGGASWDSIFSADSPPTDSALAYIAAGDYKGDQTTFAIDTLFPDDLLRVDVTVNDDAEGVEIVLEGFVASTTSP